MTTDEHWLRSIGVPADAGSDAQPDPPLASPPASALTVAEAPADDIADAAPDRPVETVAARAGVVVDLDTGPGGDTDLNDDEQPRPRRFTPWVAGAFGIAAAMATIITVTAALWGPSLPTPAAASTSTSRHPLPPPPPQQPSPAPESADAPRPFTASSDCLPGSTAAQSMADPQSRTPWICVAGGEGQVLTLDLERAYVITAVSIIPGAVTKGPDDQGDPWLQHRVVTWLEWRFNDTEHTIRRQNTHNVHGEAPLAIPSVIASRITIIIQQTSRPPQISPTTPSPTATPEDTMLGPILGAPAPADNPAPADPSSPNATAPADPSDNSFAVSSIKIIGHRAI